MYYILYIYILYAFHIICRIYTLSILYVVYSTYIHAPYVLYICMYRSHLCPFQMSPALPPLMRTHCACFNSRRLSVSRGSPSKFNHPKEYPLSVRFFTFLYMFTWHLLSPGWVVQTWQFIDGCWEIIGRLMRSLSCSLSIRWSFIEHSLSIGDRFPWRSLRDCFGLNQNFEEIVSTVEIAGWSLTDHW